MICLYYPTTRIVTQDLAISSEKG